MCWISIVTVTICLNFEFRIVLVPSVNLIYALRCYVLDMSVLGAGIKQYGRTV